MKYLLTYQQTTRLQFRKLQLSDFEIWLELFKDENTAKMLGMEGFKLLKKDVKNGLNRLSIAMKIILADKTF